MAALTRRLGILGGTFDPVHHAHLVAAEEARYQLALEKVLFMPAGDPPHKTRQPLATAADRLRMIELAVAGRPHLDVTRIDVERAGPSYTVDALELLRAHYGPDVTLFFIEGADSLAEIVTWYRPRRLLELAELAVVERPGASVDLAALSRALPGLTGRLHWVRMPQLDISSTDLRARVYAGRPIAYLVPPAVEAYIVEHGLYRAPDGVGLPAAVGDTQGRRDSEAR